MAGMLFDVLMYYFIRFTTLMSSIVPCATWRGGGSAMSFAVLVAFLSCNSIG